MKKLLLILLPFVTSFAFASAASPVTVNSITCSAGVCTIVTASTNNVSSSDPGVVLQGGPAADVGGFTVASVTNGTTFTIANTAAVNPNLVTCSSSCGTAQPAKNFLIAGNPITNLLGLQNVTVCIWNYIQTPLPVPNKTSACSSAESSANLLSAENGALASGNWYETVLTVTFATSDTRAQIEQEFQRMQFAIQLAIASGIQPGRDTGTFCDNVGCNQ